MCSENMVDGWMIHGCKIVSWCRFFFNEFRKGNFSGSFTVRAPQLNAWLYVEGKQVAPTRSGWNLSALLLLVITDDD